MSMYLNRDKYRELAKDKISEKRSVVISERSQGGITVAQQLETAESGRVLNVFLKGAFHVDGVQGLYSMRNAINAAIKTLEESQASSDSGWDHEEC